MDDASSTQKRCKKCLQAAPADASFCSKCGTPFARTECPKCGVSTKEGDAFCRICGESLREPRAPADVRGEQTWAELKRPLIPSATAPVGVRFTVWMMYASAVANVVFIPASIPAARRAVPYDAQGMVVPLAIMTALVNSALYVLLGVFLGKRRSWARIVLIVLLILGIVYTTIDALTTGLAGAGRVLLAWRFVQYGLSSVMLVALSQASVRDWFHLAKRTE